MSLRSSGIFAISLYTHCDFESCFSSKTSLVINSCQLSLIFTNIGRLNILSTSNPELSISCTAIFACSRYNTAIRNIIRICSPYCKSLFRGRCNSRSFIPEAEVNFIEPLVLFRSSRSNSWLNQSKFEVVNSEPTSSHWSFEALCTNADFAISHFNCVSNIRNASFTIHVNKLRNSFFTNCSINTNCRLELSVITTFIVQRVVHFCTNSVSPIWKTGDFLPIIEGSSCTI